MSRPPTQQLLPFDDPPETPRTDVVPYRPGADALAAVERLEGWFAGPDGGRMTDLAEDAILSVRKALVEGKNSYWHQAEDQLQALLLRNGRTEGDDIPAGTRALPGEDFHETVKALVDALHERFLARDGRRPAGP